MRQYRTSKPSFQRIIAMKASPRKTMSTINRIVPRPGGTNNKRSLISSSASIRARIEHSNKNSRQRAQRSTPTSRMKTTLPRPQNQTKLLSLKQAIRTEGIKIPMMSLPSRMSVWWAAKRWSRRWCKVFQLTRRKNYSTYLNTGRWRRRAMSFATYSEWHIAHITSVWWTGQTCWTKLTRSHSCFVRSAFAS